MADDTILDEAKRLVYGDRGEDYGHPLDDWTRVAGMFNALFKHKIKEPFAAEDMLQVPQMMKQSREVNKPKRDNRVDGAGYWACIDEVHAERTRREEAEDAK